MFTGTLRARFVTGALALLLVASFVISSVQPAFAAPIKYNDLSLTEKASAYEDALILEQCLRGALLPETSDDVIKNGDSDYFGGEVQWFTSWDPAVMSYHNTIADDNEMRCNEGKGAVRGALKRLGIDPIAFLCEIGAKRWNDKTETDCKSGSGELSTFQDKTDIWATAEKFDNAKVLAAIKKFTGLDRKNPGDHVRYKRSLTILQKGCLGDKITKAVYDKEPEGQRYKMKKYPAGNEYYKAKSNPDKKPLGANGSEKGETTCKTYWERTNTYFDAYKTYMNSLSEEDRKKEEEAVESAAGEEEPPTCGGIVNGIGWWVCPILDGIAGLNDAMWNMIKGLLQADPLMTKDANGDPHPYYRLWGAFRTFGNILLAIGFIWIIYSQLTSFGISNYGVKKLLPRLIIVAILVNLSWVIVAALVDIFNILGASLYSLLKEFAYDQVATEISWDKLLGIIIALGAGGAIAVAGIAVAGGVGAVLLFLLPIIAVGVLGLLAALVTLMIRQAMIPLLAILAPIAFAAFLLPNTEQWFKRWRQMFVSMLFLYPMAAVLFGGLQVAGKAIAGNQDDWFSVVTALIVMSVPLFMLPFLASKTGPMLSSLNGKMRGMAARLKEPAGKWAKGRADLSRARYDAKPIRFNGKGKPIMRDRVRNMRSGYRGRAADRQRETNLLSGAEEAAADAAFAARTVNDPTLSAVQQQTIANKTAASAANAAHQQNFTQGLIATSGGVVSDALGDITDKKDAEAISRTIGASVSRATQEAIKEAELSISSQSVSELQGALERAMREGDSIGARAAQNRLFASGNVGVEKYRKAMENAEASASPAVREALKQNVLENHGGMKSNAADLVAHAADDSAGGAGRTLSAVSKDKTTWEGSDADFAGLNSSSQKLAVDSGAIGRDQARRIKDDSRFAGTMKEGVREKIDHIAK